MNNRDNFIDLMEEIDQRHIDEHVKNNTDSTAKKIMRFAVIPTGIYVAACIAVLLLIPVIMNFTTGTPQSKVDPPGKVPMTTEPTQIDTIIDKPVDEYFADTKLYKVLDAAGLKREDVDFLQVDELQIVNGDLYYVFDGIYKNNDSVPIYTRNNPNMKYPIEKYFTVTGDYIICVADEDPNKVERDLYCYNMKTGEEILVCSDDIYHYDVYDGKVVYLTADSINNIKAVKVYTYDPETNKSTFVCDLPDTYHYIADISYTGSELAITNTVSENVIGQATVLDMNTKNMRYLYPTDSRGMFAITDADDGYYVAYQRANLAPEGVPIELESEYNGVWYAKVGEKPVKISDAYYSELYYVNGKLVGVYRDTVELIDTDPDTVTEFPDSREQYNDDAHREIGSKVNAAIDELYNDTIEANGGEVPKYLDSDYIATLNIGNYSSVQRQTLRYEEKCSWAIEETLEENLPEKCIMSHIPIWEIESGVIAEESDIRYFILDESLISDEIDKEELVLYLEYSYHQSRRKKHDFSQYYDIDVKALAEKYGDMGTVAVYKYGSWEYWDTGTGVMKSIERYPNYNEISALYYNFMMKD